MQKATFYNAKDGLLEAKRPSFAKCLFVSCVQMAAKRSPEAA